MGWRWQKRINFGGGVQTTISPAGAGWSWGFRYFRYGISPAGRKWISVGVPGTGLRYFSYLDGKAVDAETQPSSIEHDSPRVSRSSAAESMPGKKEIRWRDIK